jgi:predicted  nucleic acid-binding Zn-ribbon protein
MKYVMLVLALGLMSCAQESVKLPDYGDRISDLERRMLILEQVVETKASIEAMMEQNEILLSLIGSLEGDLLDLRDDLTDLSELGESAYWDLRDRIKKLRDRVADLESDERLGDLIADFDALQQQVDSIEPVVNNDNSVTFNIDINLSSLFGSINLTVNNITHENADLSDILARLDALESNTFQSQIDELKEQILILQGQVTAHQGALSYKIELCPGNSPSGGPQCSVYIVTNPGQTDYTILPAGHGFTVNNNANDLGKGGCNINNLTSVTTSQTFENCTVTKL